MVVVYPRPVFVYDACFRVIACEYYYSDPWSPILLAIVRKVKEENGITKYEQGYYVTLIREYVSPSSGILYYPRRRAKLHGPYSLEEAINHFIKKLSKKYELSKEDIHKLEQLKKIYPEW